MPLTLCWTVVIAIALRLPGPVKGGSVASPTSTAWRVADSIPFLPDDFGDRYAIERELGHGATATVYLARDLKFDRREVAIKVLSEHFALPVPRERFLREIQTTAKLNHPHIVTLIDSGTTRRAPERPFYVMRFIDGETLRDIIARGPLQLDEALRIARQAASALRHAHRHGVIHRDIKPGNIMLEDGHTWVTDFGIARAMAATDSQTVTSTGVTIGTPAYMSPEQAMGRGDLDARTDIYSLGCVLFEMLTGRMLFEGPDVQVILNKHLAEPPPPLRNLRADIPDRVQQLLDIALAKKPAERFSSAADFAHALSLEGAGPLTPTRTHPVRVRGRVLPRWVGASMAGAAVVAVGFALGTWAFGAPTLDPTAYVVVPFARADGVPASLDAGRLLQDALTGWTDIKLLGGLEGPTIQGVIDAARARDLALDQHAGHYVRGEVASVGGAYRVRAALYTTTDGAFVRERQADLPTSLAGSDSLFAALTDRLLFDDTVVAANGGRAGTRSFAARNEFARGLAAVRKWDLPTAAGAFRRASELDPAFAQAHLWVAQVGFWSDTSRSEWKASAKQSAAGRDSLSARDALLSDALGAYADNEVVQACNHWHRMTERAPHDFVGWYGFATCLTRDDAVDSSGAAPSGWQFRSSYYRATLAYAQAYQLFPSIHRALSGGSFASVRDLLMTGGADVRGGRAGRIEFASFPFWSGDTLAFAPYRKDEFPRAKVPEGVSAAVQNERELFRDIAKAWVAYDSTSSEAMEALAISQELLGDRAALQTIRRARALAHGTETSLRLAGAEVWMGIRLSLPRGDSALRQAKRLADSLLLANASSGASQPLLLASLAAVLGRGSLAAALTRNPSVLEEWNLPPTLVETAGPLLTFAGLGGPLDSLEEYEGEVGAAISRLDTGSVQRIARRWFERSAALAFPSYRFPSFRIMLDSTNLDSISNHVLYAEAAFHRNAVPALRAKFETLQKARRSLPAADVTPDALYPEAWLLASFRGADSAAAWLDGTLETIRFAQPEKFVDPANAAALVRAMALRAELAERAGDFPTARRWARAVTILWADADPFLQPTVRQMERIADMNIGSIERARAH